MVSFYGDSNHLHCRGCVSFAKYCYEFDFNKQEREIDYDAAVLIGSDLFLDDSIVNKKKQLT